MNGQNNIVTCDECGRLIDMKSVSILEEQLTDGRTGMYFVCPHGDCAAKFPFATITEEGKQLREKLARLADKVKGAKTEGKHKQAMAEYKRTLHRYQKHVTGPYTEEEVVEHVLCRR